MKPVSSVRDRGWQVVCGLLLAGLVSPASAVILEEIVARVNDAIIVRSEVETRRQQLSRQILAQYPGPEGQEYLQQAEESLLFDMINEELLIQQAKLNFDMGTYFENLKKEFMSNNDITTDKELNDLLLVEGVDLDGFRRLLLRSNVPQDVLQFDVARKISISDAEIQAYYDAHVDDFRQPGEATFREIVILAEPRGREAAQAMVDEVLARVANGEDFAGLVREYSESPSKEKDGLVGPFKSGDLSEVLEEEVFSLPVGQMGEPLETSYGFHLIQVETRADTRLASLPEVQDKVEAEVRQEKYGDSLQEYLTGLWSKNRVVVNPRYATGTLTDGGPYSSVEEIMPSDSSLGAPLPGSEASTTAGE